MHPDLIAHIEKAQPSEAWIVFGEAFRSAFPETDGFICGRKWADLYAGFVIYMNAEAYLDAAAMFVPEGWLVAHLSELGGAGGCCCTLGNPGTVQDVTADAGERTMAFALLSAAMKARQTDERD